MFVSFFLFQFRRPDMLHFQPVVPVAPETVQRAADGMDAAHKEGQEQECKKAYPMPFRQPPAEQPYPAVRPFPRFSPSPHRSTLLMSLFSNITRCSMMNPFGLSSEREAFCSSQEVTSERSVTLLSRMISCRAWVTAL